MSNLFTNKNTAPVLNLIGIGVSVVAISLMISTQHSMNETERSIAETQALLDQYSIRLDELRQQNLDIGGYTGIPDWGPWQQPVQDNDLDYPMTPPPFTVEAPTLENPFGGYEGKTIVIPIVQDGNVWTVLDSYNAESVIPLSYDANEELIHNLVNELGRQLDRDPNLVYPGEVLEIDLTDMPAPSITTVPPAETFEKPQGAGSPYSDGSDPSMHSNEGPSPVPCDPFWTATCSSNGE